ncbi:MAG: hypothetical protein OWU33_00700 [Firmicutes bacterium]|nr:hypothetical protein [Bacillota bacterium]
MALFTQRSLEDANSQRVAGRRWYITILLALLLVVAGGVLGLVAGFVWATARDYATLAYNSHEIQVLNDEVQHLRDQLALSSRAEPRGNWWLWWLTLPLKRLWLTVKTSW